MAPPPRAVVAVVAQVAAVVVLLPALLLELVVDLAAHKPLLALLQVAAVRPVPLPQEPEVAALASLLVQGLVASETRPHSR